MSFTGEVHPVADLFPMLADDELADLAADIKERGLLQPIVLDTQGRLLDGRNRYAACQLAGVEPRFTTYDGDDPNGYALAVNAQRRDLTKSKRAMVAARVSKLETYGSVRKLARTLGVNEARVTEAKAVLEYAPDLAESVVAGSVPLNKAYEEARKRKESADSTEVKMTKLRAEAPDLADEVTEERLTLPDALELLEQRRVDERLADAVAEIDKLLIADGSGIPTFAERVHSGAMSWSEAQTLAQQWRTERADAIARNVDRLERVAECWGSVRNLIERDAEHPFTAAVWSGLSGLNRELIAEIVNTMKGTR